MLARNVLVLSIIAVAVSGCATASKVPLADGKQGFVIECPGLSSAIGKPPRFARLDNTKRSIKDRRLPA